MCEYPDGKKKVKMPLVVAVCLFIYNYYFINISTYLGQPHRHDKLCNYNFHAFFYSFQKPHDVFEINIVLTRHVSDEISSIVSLQKYQ